MMSCKGKQRTIGGSCLEAPAWRPLAAELCTPVGTDMHICAFYMPQTTCNVVHVACENMRSAGMSEPCTPHHTH